MSLMDRQDIKICRLLNGAFRVERILKGYGTDIEPMTYPVCMGEGCINFSWDCGEGFCEYFRRSTGHEKESE